MDTLFKTMVEFVYPSKDICHLCMSELSDGNHLGSECRENLEFINGRITHLEDLDQVYYSLFYNRFIKEKIRDFKFHNKTYLYKVFGEILYKTYILNDLKPDIIGYVPSNRDKSYKRGYNQGELLADYLGKKLGKPVLKDNLIKVKNTRNQSDLDKLERRKNLIGAFEVKRPDEICNQKILLVDDIITTGSTLSSCAKVLVENDAKSVFGLGLASTKVY